MSLLTNLDVLAARNLIYYSTSVKSALSLTDDEIKAIINYVLQHYIDNDVKLSPSQASNIYFYYNKSNDGVNFENYLSSRNSYLRVITGDVVKNEDSSFTYDASKRQVTVSMYNNSETDSTSWYVCYFPGVTLSLNQRLIQEKYQSIIDEVLSTRS